MNGPIRRDQGRPKELQTLLDIFSQLPAETQKEIISLLDKNPDLLAELMEIIEAKRVAFSSRDDSAWQTVLEKEEAFLKKIQE